MEGVFLSSTVNMSRCIRLSTSHPRDITCVLVAGGGKTTQVKILAGDLEPTAGEVIKSSKDLRVAFLRQEFVDELVMERSLKEELISVFTEEAATLAALQACEVCERPHLVGMKHLQRDFSFKLASVNACKEYAVAPGREFGWGASSRANRAERGTKYHRDLCPSCSVNSLHALFRCRRSYM